MQGEEVARDGGVRFRFLKKTFLAVLWNVDYKRRGKIGNYCRSPGER